MSDIVMPQLGETVTEGTITKWFKKIGEHVERDELLFEVSTDKVDSEVASTAAGVLLEIRVAEGDTVDVGVVLAVVGEGAVAPPVVAPAPAPDVAPAPAAPPVVEVAPGPVAAPTPAPEATPAATTPAGPSRDGMEKVLSPVVRKLINDNNLDPAAISGTGAGGRITREDVLDVIDARQAGTPTAPTVVAPAVAQVAAAPVAGPVAAPEPIPASATPAPEPIPTPAPTPAPVAVAEPVAAPAPAAAPEPVVVPAAMVVAPVAVVPAAHARPVPAVVAGPRDEVIAFNNIRRRTGEHMLASLASAPHAFIAVEVDFSAVDRIRARQRDGFKAEEGFSLTYLPFISRAVTDAMRRYPNVNASVADGSLIVHHTVNLGIAVDLDFNGLMVPVVRDADGKRMRAIARDIHDLAGRARTKKLTPDDISGGTFTISNAGPYGIDLMQSIINQPQVAILSVTSVKKKPVVVELPDGGDTIGIHPMGMLGLSWDHRAFDGAYAASFLHEVRAGLETRDWSAEL